MYVRSESEKFSQCDFSPEKNIGTAAKMTLDMVDVGYADGKSRSVGGEGDNGGGRVAKTDSVSESSS